MNPCNLVDFEDVQAAMGIPLYQQLTVNYPSVGEGEFGSCVYGSDTEDDVYLNVDDVTRGDASHITLDENTEQRPGVGPVIELEGIGRETRYRFRTFESRRILDVVALTEKGAKLHLRMDRTDVDESELLAKARSMVVPAVRRMERIFPGNEKPPREEPPVPVCSIVDSNVMLEIYKGFWAPPPGKTIGLAEEARIGGPPKMGKGPVGGGWVCSADIAPHIYDMEAAEVFHPHVTWWISKATPSAEEASAGRQRLRGLGALSVWKVGQSWWCCGDRALNLSVFTKGGKHFEVEVDLDKMEDATGLAIAKAIAEKMLAKLP
ncbi:MAG: hypothetical protein KY429_11545 [Actinobacteria bacterium]|nr:hypothetical protein [Actinomycetota bacterium]